MSNVVEFKRKADPDVDLVWQCDCGGQAFTLYGDGRVECVSCECVSSRMICGPIH